MSELRSYEWEKKLLSGFNCQALYEAVASYRKIILFSVAIILLTYGYEIFGFSLHIDSEWYAQGSMVKDAWVTQGRWGMYWLSYWLLLTPVIPVVPVVLTVFGLAVGGWLWLASMDAARGVAAYLLMAVLLTSPIYYFVVYFTTLGYGVGIGCALIGFTTWLIMKKGPACWPLIIFMYATVIGIYQALLPVTAVALLVSALSHLLENKSDSGLVLKKIASYSICVLMGYGVYHFIQMANLSYLNLTLNDDYLNSFHHVSFEYNSISNSFINSLWSLLGYYLGSDSYFIDWLSFTVYMNIIILVNVLLRCFSGKGEIGAKFLSFLLFLTLIFTPVALLMLNSGSMPPRTQIAVVWAVAGMVFLAARAPSMLLRTLLTVMAVWCVYNFIVIVNRYSLSANLVWESNKLLSVQLLTEINRQRPQHYSLSATTKIPLEVVGIPTASESILMPRRDAIGASFFDWDGGSALRVNALWNAMGNYEFRPAQEVERQAVAAKTITMPTWPMAGSVQWLDGVVVVKFAAYTTEQQQVVCPKNPTLTGCDTWQNTQ